MDMREPLTAKNSEAVQYLAKLFDELKELTQSDMDISNPKWHQAFEKSYREVVQQYCICHGCKIVLLNDNTTNN